MSEKIVSAIIESRRGVHFTLPTIFSCVSKPDILIGEGANSVEKVIWGKVPDLDSAKCCISASISDEVKKRKQVFGMHNTCIRAEYHQLGGSYVVACVFKIDKSIPFVGRPYFRVKDIILPKRLLKLTTKIPILDALVIKHLFFQNIRSVD